MCMSRIHALYFMLHTSYSMCMYIPSACFSGSVYSYIHLMSTTQLDRSRSPTMPCILLVYIPIYLYIYIYIYRKIAARCTTRLARSRSPITGAAHTVIPIQRQHAHKIATSVYSQCTRNRYRRKMRLASESAEEEEIRLSRRQSRDRAKRAVQSSQATKNCRGSETAEARERTDGDRRKGVSIQKARRKRTHDIDNLAIIPVDSQQMPHI